MSEEKSLTLAANANDQVLFQQVTHYLKADGFDASEDGTGRGTPLVPGVCATVSSKWAKSSGGPSGDECQNLVPGLAFKPSFARGGKYSGKPSEISSALTHSPKAGDTSPHCIQGMAVRRLTPRECERLQGFPDDFTAITFRGKPAADGPRYKALGNSMAVPNIRWICRRIVLVNTIAHDQPINLLTR